MSCCVCVCVCVCVCMWAKHLSWQKRGVPNTRTSYNPCPKSDRLQFSQLIFMCVKTHHCYRKQWLGKESPLLPFTTYGTYMQYYTRSKECQTQHTGTRRDIKMRNQYSDKLLTQSSYRYGHDASHSPRKPCPSWTGGVQRCSSRWERAGQDKDRVTAECYDHEVYPEQSCSDPK